MHRGFSSSAKILWKTARISTNFTFSTKYPKKKKPVQNNSKKPVMPARLMLDTKKPSKHDAKFALTSDIEAPNRKEKEFDNMGLLPQVVQGIQQGLGFKKPSPVQASCIPILLENRHEHLLCGSQTGSGKTVAYLAPLMHFIKEQELQVTPKSVPIQLVESMNDQGDLISNTNNLVQLRKMNRPRGLVLVPSRQLVEQVLQTAKSLSYHCKMRIVGIHGRTKHVKESLGSPIDILITTPLTLANLRQEYNLSISQVQRVVIDEADTLFDTKNQKDIIPLIQTLKAVAIKQQRSCPFLLVTATFPVTLKKALEHELGNVLKVTTANLHKTPSNLVQQFLKTGGSVTKQNLLLDVIKRSAVETNRMLIFCNRTTSVKEVEMFLKDRKIQVVTVSSGQEAADIKENLRVFLDPASNSQFMACVATDMASRGVDTTHVGHVVLYDFPQTAIDYIHRVGRTARFGRSGRATSLLTRKDIALAQTIQSAIHSRQPISQ